MTKDHLPLIHIDHLSHRYNNSWAIHDINIQLNDAGVLGLLGSNGAGKSTTMNILCGVLAPTKGVVSIKGTSLAKDPLLAKRELGFLPQSAPLHTDLTVDEYLEHCAYIRQMERRKIKGAVEAVKERCGLTHFSKRLIGNLSGGYRQRVGIAQAIIHQPAVVVLDEPTNGLDPLQILDVRNLIREIAVDRAVIFSSHILSEVQVLSNQVVMIEQGKVVFSDSMDAFENFLPPNSLLLRTDKSPDIALIRSIPDVTSVDALSDQLIRVYFDGEPTINASLIQLSVSNGWGLLEISLERRSLNETFAYLANKTHTFQS